MDLQIEKNKIEMTWEYTCKIFDNYARRYLQLFILFSTFIFSTLLAMITEKCPFLIGVVIIALFLIAAIYYIYKLTTLNEKLQKSLEYLLKEMDKLNK